MISLYFIIGIVTMFGAGELYGQYRATGERRTFWMCLTGVLISILNLLTALGEASK